MFVTVDTFEQGASNRIRREERFPGGKGVHVALAVAELGEPVALLAFWGGATGQWIRTRCEEMGVRCYGPEVEGWSRTCMTLQSSGAWDDTELLGTGPQITAADFREFSDTYRHLVARADVVSMSGSWPHGAPPDGYAHLVRLASLQGKMTLLDATGSSLEEALKERPGLVHLNRWEVQSLFGGGDDLRAQALQLARACTYAAVTAGADGLYLAHGERVVHATCTVEKVISAVGSGDCLVAGLAVAMARGADLEGMARLATACGAANCIREELGMLYRRDVERLAEDVRVD